MLITVITFAVFGFLVVMTGVIALFLSVELFSADLYAVRAKRAYKNGKIDLAIMNYREALKRGKYKVASKSVCLEGLAVCLSTKGDLDAALEAFVQAEAEENATPNVYTAHASALLDTGRLRAAYDVLTGAKQKFPTNVNISSLLAQTAAKLGFFAVAEREYLVSKQGGYKYCSQLKADIESQKGSKMEIPDEDEEEDDDDETEDSNS